jgi:hypothetical protein
VSVAPLRGDARQGTGRVVRCLPHSPTFDRYIGYGRYRTWGRLGYSRRSLASPPQAVLGEEPRESFVTVAGRERYKSRFVSGASDQFGHGIREKRARRDAQLSPTARRGCPPAPLPRKERSFGLSYQSVCSASEVHPRELEKLRLLTWACERLRPCCPSPPRWSAGGRLLD